MTKRFTPDKLAMKRSMWLCGAAALALCGSAGISNVCAQETERNAPVDERGVEEIMVTASRISRAGFDAPTPVTMINRDELENRGTSNVASFLNEVPAFRAATTPSTTAILSTANGANILDLRGIGPNRTLVLVNGRRHVATVPDGTVNINVLPSGAVSRVDIVTGGASAAWGSDAVAGVVNLILDTELEGVRTEVQYGVSEEGDGDDYLVSAAAGGRFANNRGHFLIAGEYNDNKGILSQSSRDWGRRRAGILSNPADTSRTDGVPARIITTNVNNGNITEGGLIVAPTAIANIQFGPGGALQPFTPGSPRAGTFAVGGDGAWMGGYTDLSVPYDRGSILSRIDYDIADDVSLFLEMSYARARAVSETAQAFDFTPITIRADNAFIPTALRSQLVANNITQFTMTRLNTDLGFITADSLNETPQVAVGASGQFGGSWSWETYYQWGRNSFHNKQINNRIQANFFNAVDAVTSASGSIVCRANLTATNAPGCVPINIFGSGSPSAAAIEYVNGTEFLFQQITQEVASASAQGDIFDLGAGPASAAIGIEYRAESVRSDADDISKGGGFLIGNFLGVTSPEKLEVKELFGEVIVPLLKGQQLADSLEFNAAARLTDYSTSGSVVTWKVGATYSPVGDVRLRGTYSRDIRAPNFNELYAPRSLSFANVIDPTTNQPVGPLRILTSGNPNLDVERATTKTVGLVYQPEWLSGFRSSVDYYNISIRDAIGTVTPQEILNLCQAGVAQLCAAITRNNGQLFELNRAQFNVASARTNGVDIEAQYRFSLDRLIEASQGDVTIRSIASYVHDKISSANGLTFINRAGDVGQSGVGGVPHWRGSASVAYNNGPIGVYTQLRYVGAGKYDATLREPEDINDNSIGAQWYLNASARYFIGESEDEGVEVFAGVNNLFNNDPPIAPISFILTVGTNTALYDVMGRYYYAGIRTRF